MKRRILQRRVGRAAGLAAASLAAVACVGVVGGAGTAVAQSPTPLVGLFRVAPGAYSAEAGATGSYFRMLNPGGTLNGPDVNYIANSSSPASDQTYTPLSPGTQGGLVTGAYQPAPSPAFDGSGNALADNIIAPVGFFGVNFSAATETPDTQTSTAVPTPSITSDGSGNLAGNLQAFGASWNTQYFNQGSPKPDGTFPGLTAGPTGTYNSSTGAYSLTWTSEIVGGPFNGFTGQWVLAGTFSSFYITTSSLPGATRGVSYGSQQLHAAGGATPYKWKRISGALPKGLKLSGTGLISGTPKTKHVSAGTYHFTVQATTHKSKGHPKITATQALTLSLS
jgi:hypothetical protein